MLIQDLYCIKLETISRINNLKFDFLRVQQCDFTNPCNVVNNLYIQTEFTLTNILTFSNFTCLTHSGLHDYLTVKYKWIKFNQTVLNWPCKMRSCGYLYVFKN